MECLELRIYAISVKVNIDKFSRVMAQCTCAQTPHCLIIRYFHCVQKKRLKNNVPASPSLRTSTTSGSPLNPHMQSSPLTSELPLTSHTPTSSPSTPASSHLREGGECFQSTGVDTFHGSSSSSTIDVDTPCSGFSFEDASVVNIVHQHTSSQTPDYRLFENSLDVCDFMLVYTIITLVAFTLLSCTSYRLPLLPVLHHVLHHVSSLF